MPKQPNAISLRAHAALPNCQVLTFKYVDFNGSLRALDVCIRDEAHPLGVVDTIEKFASAIRCSIRANGTQRP